jgi:t-SNARE complex subunit (syntaxin)
VTTVPIPGSLRDLVDATDAESHPVDALRSSRALFKKVSEWQKRIVAEAIESGATWEEIGDALGTTRQAAWGRFRNVIEGTEDRSRLDAEEVKSMNQQVKEQVRALRLRLDHFDEKWRERQGELKKKIRELERERREERKELQQDIGSMQSSLREEMRAIRGPASR